MSGLTVKVLLQDTKKIETEALIVGFYEDVRPLKGVAGELDWLLCGSLSSLILKNKLCGALGDVALVTSQGKLSVQKIFLVGLGPRAGLSPSTLQSAAKTAAISALGAGVRSAVLEYREPADMSTDASLSALQNGLQEGAAGRSFDVAVLASDVVAYDKINRSLSIIMVPKT
jgi:hypothetical protein